MKWKGYSFVRCSSDIMVGSLSYKTLNLPRRHLYYDHDSKNNWYGGHLSNPNDYDSNRFKLISNRLKLV